ncbi:uncharacterized [Tachysurus ichikawai]
MYTDTHGWPECEHRADELIFPIAAQGKGEERGIIPALPPSELIKNTQQAHFARVSILHPLLPSGHMANIAIRLPFAANQPATASLHFTRMHFQSLLVSIYVSLTRYTASSQSYEPSLCQNGMSLLQS